ncbi:MAG: hypothetical protein ABIB47_00410 [Candidatus Woesearchaeota archaeon]
MKKGQIEIVGLMMVVILLVAVLLIALWFIAKPKSDILTPQRAGIEVKSVLLTLMKTTYEPGAGEEDFKDKIIECIEDGNCGASGGVEKKIEDVLNSFFRNKEYVLVIKRVTTPPVSVPDISIIGGPNTAGRDFLDNPCSPQNNIINPGTIMLQTVPPKIEATLTLCSLTV